MAGETVTRLRAAQTGVDRYNNPVYDWNAPAERKLAGAFFAPGGSQEPVEPGRTAVITEPEVYFPRAWPDITSTDRLRIRGDVFEVVGDPGEWRSPWGSTLGGLALRLKRVEG